MAGIDYGIIRQRVDSTNNPSLPVYDQITLAKYNGEDKSLPILLALDGLVYDVSAGATNFYNPGESYHYLVGKDSSTVLHVFGDSLIKKKYPVVGVYKI